MSRRIAALLLLMLLLVRAGLGWAGMPGSCPHAGTSDIVAQEAVEAACPHHRQETPPPCHGGEDKFGLHTEATCGCGGCHVTAALPMMAIPLGGPEHEAVLETPPPLYLSHVPPPIVRPPIPRVTA